MREGKGDINKVCIAQPPSSKASTSARGFRRRFKTMAGQDGGQDGGQVEQRV